MGIKEFKEMFLNSTSLENASSIPDSVFELMISVTNTFDQSTKKGYTQWNHLYFHVFVFVFGIILCCNLDEGRVDEYVYEKIVTYIGICYVIACMLFLFGFM